jgi:hypothetical protein
MANPAKPVDKSVDKAAVRALVAVYGGREAAKLSGLPLGTVLSWCYRYGWRKAKVPMRPRGGLPISGKGPVEAIVDALEKHKEESTMHLAEFTARAAKKAAKHADPLSVARNVRDVAHVYRAVWPEEEGGEMVEGAILVGTAQVKDDPVEMLAETVPLEDVREEFSDQGSQGD